VPLLHSPAAEKTLTLAGDYCESCRGYLKTYEGEKSESVLMADWTSIHLDVVATDVGSSGWRDLCMSDGVSELSVLSV